MKKTVKKILKCYEGKKQKEGKHGNTRWRITGVDCVCEINGILQIANDKTFDRWANSATIYVDIGLVMFEDGDVENVVRNALEIYK